MRSRYDISDQILKQTAYSETKIAHDKFTRENVIIKQYNLSLDKIEYFTREIDLLRRLNNPYLNEVLGGYEDGEHIYLVERLFTSDNLIQHILSLKYYSEDDARQYLLEIIEGISYLHSLNIHHGNLKPENLLYDEQTDCVKLSDYDYYNLLPVNMLEYGLPFCSPEELLDTELMGEQDVYAIGIIASLLLLGKLPFAADNNEDQIDSTKDYIVSTLNQEYVIPDNELSGNAISFIESCLLPEKERPCIFELLKHPFVAAKAPVIPLESTQRYLEQYVAKLSLENGSSVNAQLLVEYCQQLRNVEPEAVNSEESEESIIEKEVIEDVKDSISTTE